MADVKICDKCGTVIKQHTTGSSVVSIAEQRMVGCKYTGFDLCESCTIEVLKFITDSKEPTDTGDE